MSQNFQQAINETISHVKRKPITTHQYFRYVGIITLLLFIMYILSKPVLSYKISETVGLTDKIQVDEKAFYSERVQPIFTRYCAACHDERKTKGGLRLDNFIQARYSGKSGHNIVPFKVQDSLLITRLLLDENDKRLMPPLGWDRLTEEEITVLKLWIERGASASLASDAFPDAPLPVIEIDIPNIDYAAVKQARKPIVPLLKTLNQQFPHTANFIASDSHLVRFTNVSMQQPLDDQGFEQLTDIAPSLASLYLRNAKITEQSKDVLLTMNNLRDAFLDGVNVQETTLLTFINNQKNLQHLTINTSILTDKIKTLCSSRGIELNGVRSHE